jgi:hypothetical protein
MFAQIHSKRSHKPDESRSQAPDQRSNLAAYTPAKQPTWTYSQAVQPLTLQAKLTINQPGDAYEQEADQVAAQVMRMDDPVASGARRCACGGIADESGECVACRAKRLGVQRKSDAVAGAQAPASVHETISAPGQPLDGSTRAFMEPRFGQNFGGVRVHTDANASESAKAVSAHAYTVGQNVVFGAGKFAPQTHAGRQLLAHELAHVVQQSGGDASTLQRVPTRDGIPERFSFSSNCGWIDWSHADPGLVNTLVSRIQSASDALQDAGSNPSAETGDLSTPTMTSTVPYLGTVLSSARLSVRLLRPLSADEVIVVALSLFKKLSIVFETQQEWTDLVGSSSFAQEDLPSNLIAFYRAARGFSRADIGTFCGEVSADAARAEFDRDHDFEKNRRFAPVGISGTWPLELSSIDDLQASALYDIRTISAVQGTTGFQFCPMYRIQGLINETDLFIIGIGGTRFTAADNVRVAPTYRFRSGTHGTYGHTTFIEVEPNGQADYAAFADHKIPSRLFVPHNVLVCLSSQGNSVP